DGGHPGRAVPGEGHGGGELGHPDRPDRGAPPAALLQGVEQGEHFSPRGEARSMTELLQRDERDEVERIARDLGPETLGGGCRRLRLGFLDRTYASSLPDKDDPFSQFWSDIATMNSLPYLVTRDG